MTVVVSCQFLAQGRLRPRGCGGNHRWLSIPMSDPIWRLQIGLGSAFAREALAFISSQGTKSELEFAMVRAKVTEVTI